MKKFLNYFLILALVPVLVLSSCSKDEDPEEEVKGTFTDLKNHLVNSNMDLPNILDSWITSAEAIHGKGLDAYHIMDIRSPEAFDLGHIPGAVPSSLGTIVTDAAGVTKPIIVACYTGQSASHAVVALRLSGFPTAKVLKWGMSGWHEDFAASWNDGVGSDGIGHANWSMDATTPTEAYSYPEWETTATDGAGILAERVTAFLAGGFKGVPSSTVLAAPSDYFINNYWEEDDVTHYGHIKYAYRVLPLSLANDEIQNLDASETIVTYCWTGQTSSMVTAYLNVLGYNAVSLKFGVNSMIYDNLESHKWSAGAIMNYDYDTTK